MKKIVLILLLIMTATTSLAQNPHYEPEQPSEGLLSACDTNGKWGYITQAEHEKHNGKWNDIIPTEYKNRAPYTFAIKPKFDIAMPFYGGVAIVSIARKFGLIDKQGNVVCPITYTPRHSIQHINEHLTIIYDPYEKETRCKLFRKATRKIDGTNYKEISLEGSYIRVGIDHKFGALDFTGKQIIPPIYSSIEPFDKGLIKATIEWTRGLIDTTGREVISCNLRGVQRNSGNFIFVEPNIEKWCVIDITGKLVKDLGDLSYIGELNCGLAYAKRRDSDNICYIDSMGNTKIEGQFLSVDNFAENLAAVKNPDGKWGYIDTTGKFVIEPQFDYAWPFSDGLAIVRLDNKFGYIDKLGQIVIEPIFSSCGQFSQGLAQVRIGDKWGYINKKGKIVIDTLFSVTYNFYNDRALVRNGDKGAYIDTTGSFVTDYIFDKAWDFSEDVTAVCYNGKWGFIDKSGRMVIEAKYDDAMPYYNGIAIVKSANRWSYIDRKGDIKFTTEYDDAKYFVNGLAPVYQKQQGMLFDMMGDVVLKPKYERIEQFSPDGLAAVCLNGYWGYIDRNYKLVIEPKYDYARSFSGWLAAVEINGKWGYINKKGVVVVKPQFDIAEEFNNGYAVIGMSSSPGDFPLHGVIDGRGKVIIEPKYDDIQPYDGGGLFNVCLDSRWGSFDVNGKVVIDFKYDAPSPFGYSQRALISVGEEWYEINRKGKIVDSPAIIPIVWHPSFLKSHPRL